MTLPRNGRSGRSSWTARCSTPSSTGCAPTSACPRSPRRCRRVRASRSRRCRCSLAALLRGARPRPLCVLLPDDADARDARRGGRLVPRRGARRALPVARRALGLGARAAAAPRRRAGARARRARARRARLRLGARARRADAAAGGAARRRSRSRRGDEPGIDAARRGARARRLRARRAGRGARPVRRARRARRRLPDHRPRAAPDRALRRRDRGHPRLLAVHAARAARDRRARRSTRRPSGAASSSRSRSPTTRTARAGADPGRPRAAARPPARPRLAARRGARGLGRGGPRRAVARRRDRARPVPAGPAVLVRRAAAGARRPAGCPRPRTSSTACSARASTSSSRSPTAARPSGSGTCSAASSRRCSRRASSRRASSFAVAPARRGFVWRDLGVALLPDTQVFRRRPPRATAPIGRALASFSDLRTGDYVVHEDHGDRAADRLRDEGGRRASSATTSCSAFRGDDRVFVPHEQIGKVSRYIGSDSKAPTLSKLGGKAWDNLKNRARAHLREMAGELLAALRRAADAAGRRLRRRAGVGRAARGRVPVPRDRGSGARDRGGQGGPRGAAPDGPARLRRRRLRQDRGRAPRRVHRRGRRQAGADARADDDPRAAALEHVPRALPRLPGARRDGLALPQAGRRQEGARRVRRGQGRRADRDAPRALARRDPEGPRARDRRRGAALRRRAEGAAAPAAARGRRARAVARRRSRARCTCRSPGCATSR